MSTDDGLNFHALHLVAQRPLGAADAARPDEIEAEITEVHARLTLAGGGDGGGDGGGGDGGGDGGDGGGGGDGVGANAGDGDGSAGERGGDGGIGVQVDRMPPGRPVLASPPETPPAPVPAADTPLSAEIRRSASGARLYSL